MPPTTPAIPKVVLDCNVFLQALVNPDGPAGRRKRLVDRGEVGLYVSEDVLAEVAEVLSRPRARKLAPALTLEVIEAFIINLAIVAGAKFIVSRDNDLLDLMKPNSEAASEFQRRFPMLKIGTPVDLLVEVESKSN